MGDLDLTQSEAQALIAMEKHRVDGRSWAFPLPGGNVNIPLTSADKRENFLLDVTRKSVVLNKITYQNRARKTLILIRLDLNGSPHRNPDGEELPCPHIHYYREGYGDKWAYQVSSEMFPDLENFGAVLELFMQHCNITEQPIIEIGLF